MGPTPGRSPLFLVAQPSQQALLGEADGAADLEDRHGAVSEGPAQDRLCRDLEQVSNLRGREVCDDVFHTAYIRETRCSPTISRVMTASRSGTRNFSSCGEGC